MVARPSKTADELPPEGRRNDSSEPRRAADYGTIAGTASAAWLERDDRVMSPSYTRAYPLVVRRARGAMIEDMDGNRFLDFTAGIAVTNVGHSHPRVVAAIRRQASRLIHMSGTDFYYAPQVRLAERLAALAPGPGEKRVFFTNSGAEAIEAALKLARRHTGRNRVMAFMNAFHGRTYGAMSLSGLEADAAARFLAARARYSPCPLRRPRKRACLVRARSAPPTSWRRSSSSRSRARGATSCRPPIFCRACAGFATSTECCWSSTRSRAAWAERARCSPAEHWGVAGDILCMAKGIANGLPLGAIVARASVMDWPSGSHASTFGGNPVACAASLATIRLLENALHAPIRQSARRAASRGTRARLAHRFSVHPRGPRARADDRRRDPVGDAASPIRDCATSSSTWRFIAGCLLAALRPQHGPVLPAAVLDGATGRNRSRDSVGNHGSRRQGDQAIEGRTATESLGELEEARDGTDLNGRGRRVRER